jgi:hypothetical protein
MVDELLMVRLVSEDEGLTLGDKGYLASFVLMGSCTSVFRKTKQSYGW